jgi:hypothetical protein
MPSRRGRLSWRRIQLRWIEEQFLAWDASSVKGRSLEYIDFLGRKSLEILQSTHQSYWAHQLSRYHKRRRRRIRSLLPPPTTLQWLLLQVGTSRVWIRVKSRKCMGEKRREKGGEKVKGNLAESTTNLPPFRHIHSNSLSPSIPPTFSHLTNILPPLPTPLPPIPPEPPPPLPKNTTLTASPTTKSKISRYPRIRIMRAYAHLVAWSSPSNMRIFANVYVLSFSRYRRSRRPGRSEISSNSCVGVLHDASSDSLANLAPIYLCISATLPMSRDWCACPGHVATSILRVALF